MILYNVIFKVCWNKSYLKYTSPWQCDSSFRGNTKHLQTLHSWLSMYSASSNGQYCKHVYFAFIILFNIIDLLYGILMSALFFILCILMTSIVSMIVYMILYNVIFKVCWNKSYLKYTSPWQCDSSFRGNTKHLQTLHSWLSMYSASSNGQYYKHVYFAFIILFNIIDLLYGILMSALFFILCILMTSIVSMIVYMILYNVIFKLYVGNWNISYLKYTSPWQCDSSFRGNTKHLQTLHSWLSMYSASSYGRYCRHVYL